jgi:ribonuclease P protein subunit POP4
MPPPKSKLKCPVTMPYPLQSFTTQGTIPHIKPSMDRSNVIEHLLLSRCAKHNNNGELLQFLEQRYSFSGPQKNYLVLEPTEFSQISAENEKKAEKQKETVKDFLKEKPKTSSAGKVNKYNELRTKNEFKKFVQESMKLQHNVARKLKKLVVKNPEIRNMEDVIGLRICEGILKFEDFMEMNTLWNNYVQELISNCKTIDVITAKLSSAEFVGAYFTVTHCTCPENIGIEGIVLWESQTYILMVIPRKNNWKESISLGQVEYSAREMIGGLRMIPKKKTRFTFSIEVKKDEDNGDDEGDFVDFEFIGDRLSIKSLDRANKKFKSHNVKDIQL